MRFSVVTLLTFLFCGSALAEYRAFELEIVDQASGAKRTVISTLDDLQYRGYYPLKQSEEIVILDTWMCWGRTDRRPICPSPNRAPATNAAPSP